MMDAHRDPPPLATGSAPRRAADLRDRMPSVAAFIDAMRAEFGREGIDAAIRDGLAGREGFYAQENGHVVGTPLREPAAEFTVVHPDRWERLHPEHST